MEIPMSSLFSEALASADGDSDDDVSLEFCDAFFPEDSESEHDSEADAAFYETSGVSIGMQPGGLVHFMEYFPADLMDEYLAHHEYYENLNSAIHRCAKLNSLHLSYSLNKLIKSFLELHDTLMLGRPHLAQTLSAALPPSAQTPSAAIAALEPVLPDAALATLSGHTVAMAGNQPAHNPVKPSNSYLHYLYRTVATNLNSHANSLDFHSNSSQFSVLPLTERTKS